MSSNGLKVPACRAPRVAWSPRGAAQACGPAIPLSPDEGFSTGAFRREKGSRKACGLGNSAPRTPCRIRRAGVEPTRVRRPAPRGVRPQVNRKGNDGYQAGLLEPPVAAAGRAYVELLIEQANSLCRVMMGVTGLTAPPADGAALGESPLSVMLQCSDSMARRGGEDVDFGATGRRGVGERVGLLVDRGRLFAYVNGARIGGCMAEQLPPRVRFAVDLRFEACQAGPRARSPRRVPALVPKSAVPICQLEGPGRPGAGGGGGGGFRGAAQRLVHLRLAVRARADAHHTRGAAADPRGAGRQGARPDRRSCAPRVAAGGPLVAPESSPVVPSLNPSRADPCLSGSLGAAAGRWALKGPSKRLDLGGTALALLNRVPSRRRTRIPERVQSPKGLGAPPRAVVAPPAELSLRRTLPGSWPHCIVPIPVCMLGVYREFAS